jgi:hypothetical protein
VIKRLVVKFLLWRAEMKLRKWMHAIQWANMLVLGAGILNNVTEAVPSLQANQTVLVIQAVLAGILPSVGGVSHKIDKTKVVPTQ